MHSPQQVLQPDDTSFNLLRFPDALHVFARPFLLLAAGTA
jgi:hypothetical protein